MASTGTNRVGDITAVGPRFEDHPTDSVAKAAFAPSITDAVSRSGRPRYGFGRIGIFASDPFYGCVFLV